MTLLDAILLGALACVLLLGARWTAARAYLRVNPKYSSLLQSLGLTSPRAILALPAVIVCGHPDRNVSRVTLGAGPDAVSAFLKREHRVRWTQRILNVFSGFGPVSLSQRESDTLDRLRRACIGSPDWIAVGADGRGRAFLLVEELSDCIDLRRFLADWTDSARERHRFARHLGESLARLHDTGFVHRDLYAKHILVHKDDHTLHLLDWQRSPQPHRVSQRERWHDLAALDATLAEELATTRERLSCLHAYCKVANVGGKVRGCFASPSAPYSGERGWGEGEGISGSSSPSPPTPLPRVRRRGEQTGKALFLQSLVAIKRQRGLLSHRRHICEARQVPKTTTQQELIWLDGEALCVTLDYYRQWSGRLPSTDQPPLRSNQVRRDGVSLSQGGHGFFARRCSDRFFAWLLTWFGAKPLVAPEVREAGLLFRLQRYGVRTARLLAFGQRPTRPWRMESFLLTEIPRGARGFLKELDKDCLSRRRRSKLLREAGATMQRLHTAGCFLRDDAPVEDDFLTVHESAEGASTEPTMAVTLTRVDCVRLHRRPTQALAARDLAALGGLASAERVSQSDKMRFLLTYFGLRRLNSDAKYFVRLIESQIRTHRSKGNVP